MKAYVVLGVRAEGLSSSEIVSCILTSARTAGRLAMEEFLAVSDDGFEPFWLEETDWLVTVCMIPADYRREDQLQELAWIGRLSAFAHYTETRMLALVGDPFVPTYELLFSFQAPENKTTFLQLVKEDGYLDPDEENAFSPPASEEIREARPLGYVFPEQDSEYITRVAAMTLIGLQTDASNSDA